jgi:hypothetical protein
MITPIDANIIRGTVRGSNVGRCRIGHREWTVSKYNGTKVTKSDCLSLSIWFNGLKPGFVPENGNWVSAMDVIVKPFASCAGDDIFGAAAVFVVV